MDRLAPPVLEVVALLLCRPVSPDDFVRGGGIAGQSRKKIVRRIAVVQRQDERLQDCRGAIEGSRITPGLKCVRFGNYPVAEVGGLVGTVGKDDPVANS